MLSPLPTRSALARVIFAAVLAVFVGLAPAQDDDPFAGPLPPSNAKHWKDLTALIERAQPEAVRGKTDAPNGFVLLRALGEKVEAERQARASTEAGAMPYNFDAIARPSPDTAGDVEAARRGLEAYEKLGFFDAIDEIGRAQRVVRPASEGALISVLLPDMGRARTLTRALAARFEIALADGRPADAVREFDRMLILARVPAFGPTLIERLVATAIAARATDHLRGAILAGKLGPAELQAAARSMVARLGDWPTMALAIEGERLMALDAIDIVYSSAEGKPQDRPNLRRLAVIQSMSVPAGADEASPQAEGLATAAELRERADMLFAQLVRAAKLPRPQRTGENSLVSKESLTSRDLLLQILLPAMGKALQSADHFATDCAATETIIALERFRARTGAYPEALAALVPAELAAQPIDAWSGASLRYRREGASYRLYAVGLDGRDDGGKGDPADPFRAVLPAGAGLDYVYR
ncbi:MAG: hypothetical protein SFY95_08600 [Planctomycetota bacterium]|nr:hypothetical protein [Planctomycetota bacterium]